MSEKHGSAWNKLLLECRIGTMGVQVSFVPNMTWAETVKKMKDHHARGMKPGLDR